MKRTLDHNTLTKATAWASEHLGEEGYIDNTFTLHYNDSLMHLFTLEMPWQIEGDPSALIARGIPALVYKTAEDDAWGVLFYTQSDQIYVRSVHVTTKNTHQRFVNFYPNANPPQDYQDALFALEQL